MFTQLPCHEIMQQSVAVLVQVSRPVFDVLQAMAGLVNATHNAQRDLHRVVVSESQSHQQSGECHLAHVKIFTFNHLRPLSIQR